MDTPHSDNWRCYNFSAITIHKIESAIKFIKFLNNHNNFGLDDELSFIITPSLRNDSIYDNDGYDYGICDINDSWDNIIEEQLRPHLYWEFMVNRNIDSATNVYITLNNKKIYIIK